MTVGVKKKLKSTEESLNERQYHKNTLLRKRRVRTRKRHKQSIQADREGMAYVRKHTFLKKYPFGIRLKPRQANITNRRNLAGIVAKVSPAARDMTSEYQPTDVLTLPNIPLDQVCNNSKF